MAERMKRAAVAEMARNYFGQFLDARHNAFVLEGWMRGTQDRTSDDLDLDPTDRDYGQTFAPREQLDEEFLNLKDLSVNALGGLIVKSLAQTAHVEGMYRPSANVADGQNIPEWDTFRRNRMLSRQNAWYSTAIGMGVAYAIVIPGSDPLTGEAMSKILLRSPKTFCAFYDSDDDEWAKFGLEAHPVYAPEALGSVQTGWTVQVYDAEVVHYLSTTIHWRDPENWTYISYEEHGLPVPPVVRLPNSLDLDGQATGELEPVVPLLRRIDQGVMDRLVTQRFTAWQVRYIAGMAKPQLAEGETAEDYKMRLRQDDLLISTNPETKFGVLQGGSIDAQVKGTEEDLRILSAITQIPPHHLLGLSSNLQAEALVAATEGLMRKSFDFRQNADEAYEQIFRLDAMIRGDIVAATSFDLRLRWRDPEQRSLAQAADAVGKLVQQVGLPIEMALAMIPGFDDSDVARAIDLIESGQFEQMLSELMGSAETPTETPVTEEA